MNDYVCSCTRGAPPLPDRYSLSSGRGAVGDLVLGEIVEVGFYRRLEPISGIEVDLALKDTVIGVLANRYSATCIYGGIVSGSVDVSDGTVLDLLCEGGQIGVARSSPHGGPTKVRLRGLVADRKSAGRPLSMTIRYADSFPHVPIVLVGGTASETGKTTFAKRLVNHLSARGDLRVGAAKLAGTGRMRDLRSLLGAGAHCGLDFVDAGLASTYGHDDGVVAGAARYIFSELAQQQVDVIVAELGGDLWEAGVPEILRDRDIQQATVGLIVVPSDTMASLGASVWVEKNAIPIPVYHAAPPRNIEAARVRMQGNLGVGIFDAGQKQDLETLANLLLNGGNRGGGRAE